VTTNRILEPWLIIVQIKDGVPRGGLNMAVAGAAAALPLASLAKKSHRDKTGQESAGYEQQDLKG